MNATGQGFLFQWWMTDNLCLRKSCSACESITILGVTNYAKTSATAAIHPFYMKRLTSASLQQFNKPPKRGLYWVTYMQENWPSLMTHVPPWLQLNKAQVTSHTAPMVRGKQLCKTKTKGGVNLTETEHHFQPPKNGTVIYYWSQWFEYVCAGIRILRNWSQVILVNFFFNKICILSRYRRRWVGGDE